jgi:hypothetical protein
MNHVKAFAHVVGTAPRALREAKSFTRPKTAFARNSVPSQNQQRHGDGKIFLEQSRGI